MSDDEYDSPKRSKWDSIEGWTPELELLFTKRIQEHGSNLDAPVYGKAVRRAVIDPQFRAELERDPVRVLKELGVTVPAERINVVVDSEEVFNLVIPKVIRPVDLKDIDLVSSVGEKWIDDGNVFDPGDVHTPGQDLNDETDILALGPDGNDKETGDRHTADQ